MSSFDSENNIEENIEDRLITTVATTGLFVTLKAANVNPPKGSLDHRCHETSG